MIERQRRSWPAGFIIVPAALLLALLQILIPSSRDRTGWSQDRPPTQAAAPAATEARPAEAAAETGAAQPDAVAPPRARAGAPEAAAAPPAASPIEVSICHSEGDSNALRALQVAAFLQTRGFDVTEIRPVKDRITRPSVRYFAARDLLATQHLVGILGTFFARIPGQGPAYPVGLNESSPKPVPGRVEVWLPAAGGADSRSA